MRLKKRTLVLLGVMVVAIAAAIGAYAYFTTTGSGNGTATVGTSSAVTLHGSTSGLLYPGDLGHTVSFTVDNPSTGNQSVSNIHLVSVSACSVVFTYPGGVATCADVTPPVCGGVNSASSDFQMADVPVNPATDGNIAPSAVAQPLVTTGTLYMNNLATNQDTCKNAFLNLVLTST